MTIKVMVFPCGSEIGLEIHSALKYAKDVELYGVSSVSDHGEFVYARYRQIDAQVDSAEFIEQLNRLIGEWQIDMVVPAHDSVILKLAEEQGRLAARAAVPEVELARICRNKNATYAHFAGYDFVPDTVSGLASSYPVFAKPAVGQGSQGVELVRDAARHQELLDCGIEYVFSEYLPGEEFTVDCISDAQGVLLRASPRERARVKSGISVRTRPIELGAEVDTIAACIAESFRFKGAWFFQVKRARDGRLKLLEVAPRTAGSMGLSRNLGINYPLLSLYAYSGLAFSVIAQRYPIEMDRALKNCFKVELDFDRVYLDLDDTLILRGAVNALLMALIYQWLARGVEIVLITRHASCPRETLARHRIAPEIFAKIIHIQDGMPKSGAISQRERSIFIDDAYRERQDVSTNLGIPVFDLDAIEQLLDWRA
ncbi:ATP-grasp domain-containing protein [Metapseudomonas resinovorans]|nr:ATP-grasp domain-containing protein [Pseudomonas resinovorans]